MLKRNVKNNLGEQIHKYGGVGESVTNKYSNKRSLIGHIVHHVGFLKTIIGGRVEDRPRNRILNQLRNIVDLQSSTYVESKSLAIDRAKLNTLSNETNQQLERERCNFYTNLNVCCVSYGLLFTVVNYY